jgi:hypothetical protein
MDTSEIRSELRIKSELASLRAELADPRVHSNDAIVATLKRLPPGTLKRDGDTVTFTPHPPKKPSKTERQALLNFRVRAHLALMDN